MVYRELRETCSKLGEEMFSKSAEAGSNVLSCAFLYPLSYPDIGRHIYKLINVLLL